MGANIKLFSCLRTYHRMCSPFTSGFCTSHLLDETWSVPTWVQIKEGERFFLKAPTAINVHYVAISVTRKKDTGKDIKRRGWFFSDNRQKRMSRWSKSRGFHGQFNYNTITIKAQHRFAHNLTLDESLGIHSCLNCLQNSSPGIYQLMPTKGVLWLNFDLCFHLCA